MNMREARLLLLVLALGLSLAFVIAPRARGQRNKRHTCRQECASKYQGCLGKENADAAECEKVFDECREECGGSKSKPEAERAANANAGREGRAGQKAGAAELNADASENANRSENTNGNANTTVKGNVNGSRNGSAGGSETPPPAPVKKDGKNPPAAQH